MLSPQVYRDAQGLWEGLHGFRCQVSLQSSAGCLNTIEIHPEHKPFPDWLLMREANAGNNITCAEDVLISFSCSGFGSCDARMGHVSQQPALWGLYYAPLASRKLLSHDDGCIIRWQMLPICCPSLCRYISSQCNCSVASH